MLPSKVFLTGHTGFKGTWLVHLLSEVGVEVHGYSDRSFRFFEESGAEGKLASSTINDIRDFKVLREAISDSKSVALVHFAAQPLVSEGYTNAFETFQVNSGGTLNVLEAARQVGLERVLIITTDKVYRPGSKLPFREEDPLGGLDPYSASKSSADLCALSYSKISNFRIDVARGGNVIGGGDYSRNRLIPDIERSIQSGEILEVRNPNQIRPWQHVLDCLDGYLAILRSDRMQVKENSWNVGPPLDEAAISVSELISKYEKFRKAKIASRYVRSPYVETDYLRLDVSRIHAILGWTSFYSQEQAIGLTAEWHSLKGSLGPAEATSKQITDFVKLAF